MSTKHYFPETAVNTLVPRYLNTLVTTNPSLTLLPTHRILLDSTHSPTYVTLISGGGSGHEPAWAGYVGYGLLAAAVCGDIFASPSMKQILAAIIACPSEKGTILLITNYTGDKLHFGMAVERALERGVVRRGKCVILAATDDVSIGRSKCGRVGRRGLAGNVITMKILGAAAAREYSLEKCVEIGRAVNEQLVSIGSALDHCHVPGRQKHDEIAQDACYFGAGIHNEPGARKISPFPTVKALISQLLKSLCDQNDTDRAFVKFNKADDTVLLINNYGGLSNLELGALTDEVLAQLDTTWNIAPIKIYSGTFETSLNGPGFSITLCNLSLAAKESQTSVHELVGLLFAETKAPAWPNTFSDISTKSPRKEAPSIDLEKKTKISPEEDFIVDPKHLEATIRLACERGIAAEPDLTKWDMVMGDGDCGEAVSNVSIAILKLLDSGAAESGSILYLLSSVIDAVDDMGGTLGAILGILLAALATSLRSQKFQANSSTSLLDVIAPALTEAVGSLKKHTGARVGDRTVMDVLIPFQETLERSKNLREAVTRAEEAAEGTRDLKPKFGRASYIGAGGKEQRLPDPGAWALKEYVKAFYDANKQQS